MKKRITKLVALLMASTIAVTALPVVCSAEEVAQTEFVNVDIDTSEEVEIVMYVLGDRPAGQDVVDENINRILKEKLNCTLKMNWIGWAEYANKYPLLFASGEKFDMIYVSDTWLNFSSHAKKGAFMSLNNLWEKYAPNNYAKQTANAIAEATHDGEIYAIPSLRASYNAYGPMYRKDILEGTDWDGVIETFEDVEEFGDLVKETHPEMEVLDIYSMGSNWDDMWMGQLGYVNVDSEGLLWYDPNEENPQLFTLYEEETTKEFLETMARWNEKGFFSKSALADTDSTKFANSKAALRIHNIDTYITLYAEHPEWDIEFSNMRTSLKHLPFMQDGMAISSTSENPERALAVWDLLVTDQEFYDAFNYGILDTTYTLNDAGQYQMTDPNLYATTGMFSARVMEYDRQVAGAPEDLNDTYAEWEAQIAENGNAEKFGGFVLDYTPVETEFATCSNIQKQYWWPLELGYTDGESGLEEYQKMLEIAGIETLRAEWQAQLDAYLATK